MTGGKAPSAETLAAIMEEREKWSERLRLNDETWERRLYDERETRYEQRYQAQQQALAPALSSLERSLTILAEKMDSGIGALSGEVKIIASRLDTGEGKSGGRYELWIIAGGAILLAITLWNTFGKAI